MNHRRAPEDKRGKRTQSFQAPTKVDDPELKVALQLVGPDLAPPVALSPHPIIYFYTRSRSMEPYRGERHRKSRCGHHCKQVAPIETLTLTLILTAGDLEQHAQRLCRKLPHHPHYHMGLLQSAPYRRLCL